MTNHARAERAALCDLFVQVGPDAPTLCAGWTARDLAAHLVVRESRPDAAVGIVVKPLSRYEESVRSKVAAWPWEQLMNKVRNGPPSWSPLRPGPIDRLANTIEFFVHHEDVRRAVEGWEPRLVDPDLQAQMWKLLGRLGRLVVRRSPAGIVLVNPAGERMTAKSATPSVDVTGEPGELVLFVYGRQAHSRAVVTGPAESVEAVRTARFGI